MSAARMTIPAAVLVLAAGCGKDTITLNGMVVNDLGIPLASVYVMVGDYGEHHPAVTGQDGRFTMEEVEAPYGVQLAGGYCGALTIYQGLTRRDPVLTMFGAEPVYPSTCPPSPWNATVAGALSGGAGFPQPTGHLARVAFCAQDFHSTWFAAADGTYSSAAQWTGRDPVGGDLHALQWQEDANGLPSSYTGYGARPGVLLTDEANLTGQDIALGSVATGSVSGAATVPAGYSLVLRTMALRVGEHGYLSIVEEASIPESPLSPDFAYQVPQVPGGKIAVMVEAVGLAGEVSTASRALEPGASGVSVAPPAAATLLQPPADAVDVMPGALFQWSPSAAGVHVLTLISHYGISVLPQAVIVTAETSFASPPIPDVYCGLPCGSGDFTWGVATITLHQSVDAAAGGPVDLGYSSAAAFDADQGIAHSSFRGFSTVWTGP